MQQTMLENLKQSQNLKLLSQLSKTTQKKLKEPLNSQNYYDNTADWRYMSPTLFKRFMACEFSALHALENPKENNAEALVVGNYVHSYFDSVKAHATFVKDHEQIINGRGGKPKAAFVKAQKMIDRLDNWHAFKAAYKGEKEAIVTGNIFGVDWKGKIDCLNVEAGIFFDIKTTRSIHDHIWSEETRTKENFVVRYNYTLQIAAYKTMLEQMYEQEFTPVIVAVSKEDHPDIQMISFDGYDFEQDLQLIKDNQEHIMNVIYGKAEPFKCGHCDYCKDTKQPTDVISVLDL
ncbi:PD-(D/E)XK nuclease-like domain-containing protein [Latilactobacillus curvatus]|uniref:PD-(D/E)XK nuclease-like domain-containing protein n=1 Tax=Latilactobacillus curvatus TaxID=28038 RepID=UPI002074A418|nr:PD-(D/E)XK nuclease-like domain-containing protein [Latilactobacillus curvatus]MCM6843990.1 PD-(D/E)XK nuclease-like domain-containing protein [Latilactobacillus curvatus]MCM6861123.1 PD-(D/E)XK nuclease-like domain-containing protein [Latilactobacillus curvatus]MCM6868421.1 PD-(D/E)XK nuclease-like domain-containing protein [Latilactobacillus curvatus]